ncbi:MAG: YceI family protein [Flavitalea sp.]
MKQFFILVFALTTAIGTFAQTAWKNDKNHSKLTFGITHLAVSEVTGLFKDFNATITASKPDFSDAVVELTVQTTSVNTEVEKRDNHLRSADFFEVDKFPIMTFISTSILKVSDGKYKVTGNLTLHGVTKPVTVDLWHRGTIENPNSKTQVAGFQITATIKRSDFAFGQKYTNPILGDVVSVKADGEFSPAK